MEVFSVYFSVSHVLHISVKCLKVKKWMNIPSDCKNKSKDETYNCINIKTVGL